MLKAEKSMTIFTQIILVLSISWAFLVVQEKYRLIFSERITFESYGKAFLFLVALSFAISTLINITWHISSDIHDKNIDIPKVLGKRVKQTILLFLINAVIITFFFFHIQELLLHWLFLPFLFSVALTFSLFFLNLVISVALFFRKIFV